MRSEKIKSSTVLKVVVASLSGNGSARSDRPPPLTTPRSGFVQRIKCGAPHFMPETGASGSVGAPLII